MGSVCYYKYFCECGQFLFENSHIIANHSGLGRNYIFVERNNDIKIKVHKTSIVVCKKCGSPLGGIVYRRNMNKPDLIRFVGHKILRQKVNIVIFRRNNKYGMEFLYGSLVSRRYQNYLVGRN